jgi:hypothetical protein
MLDEVLNAIEEYANASLDGQLDPQIEQIKKELEKLSDRDIEEMRKTTNPLEWVKLFLSALTLGKQLRDMIRDVRNLP